MDFEKKLPGASGGKPDKDEMEMMKDIMGGDMENDLGGDMDDKKKKASVKTKANTTALALKKDQPKSAIKANETSVVQEEMSEEAEDHM